MIGWLVVLTIWSVVAAGLVLWFGRALAAFEAPYGPPRDATACACCRHDAVAHEHPGPGARRQLYAVPVRRLPPHLLSARPGSDA